MATTKALIPTPKRGVEANGSGPTFVTEIIEVTPDLAAEWLEKYNTHNRKLRSGSVAAYARDMANGRWDFTGDAIKFGTNGVLLDGQNRLAAVIEADVPVKFLVVRGIDPEAQQNMDAHAKRTHADNLNMQGEKHYSFLAAVCRLAVLHETNRLTPSGGGSNFVVTNREINDWLDSHPDIRDAVSSATAWKTHIDAPSSVIAFAYWRLSGIDALAAEKFFHVLGSRVGLEAGDPILALDSRLRQVRRERVKASQYDYLSLFIKAWNYWRVGKAVQSLTLKGTTGIPEPR